MPKRRPSTALVEPRPTLPPDQAQRAKTPPPRPPAATETPARVEEYGQTAPQVHWSDGVQFDKTASHAIGSLWALCAVKYAYSDSGATHNVFRDAVGATSVEQVDFDDVDSRIPKLLRIETPQYRILVLRGTTQEAQKSLFLASRVMRYRVTANWIEPETRQLSYSAEEYSALLLRGFGAIFSAFAELAGPVFDYIGSLVESDKGSKKTYLVGHSLGAAILDLCVLRFAKLRHDTRYLFSPDLRAAAFTDDRRIQGEAFDRAFQGAYLFGSPQIGFFGGPYVGEISAGQMVTIDGGPLSQMLYEWPWWYYANYTRHLSHRWDPCTLVPMSRTTAPALLRWFGPPGLAADADCGRYGVTWRGGVGEMEGEERDLTPPIPTTIATVLDRATRYHTAGQLLRLWSNLQIKRYPNPPAAWSNLINAALELNGDSITPWG